MDVTLDIKEQLKKAERENIILTDLWNTTQRLVLQHKEEAQTQEETMTDDILAELNTL